MATTQTEARGKGAVMRDRIIVEARRTLVDQGYDDVSLRGVAERLGITLGNLQYYFRTRDDLLLEVVRLEAAADLDTLRAIVAVDRPASETLERLVHALVGTWRSGGGVVFTTLAFLSLHRDVFRAEYRRVYAQFYDALEDAIECADPAQGRTVYQQRARLLTALIDGAAMQIHVGSRARYLESVVDAAMHIALPDGR
jgi:AcrR family transcriptional regulator